MFLDLGTTLLGLFIGIAVGMVIAMIVALLVGVPTLRLKGDYLAIATLGVSEIIRVLINNLRDITNGPAGISGIPLVTSWELVYIFLIIIVTINVCYTYSSSGRATLAINQNEIAAEAMGVSVTKYKVMAFVIGAMTAAVGAGIYKDYNECRAVMVKREKLVLDDPAKREFYLEKCKKYNTLTKALKEIM